MLQCGMKNKKEKLKRLSIGVSEESHKMLKRIALEFNTTVRAYVLKAIKKQISLDFKEYKDN